MKTVINNALSKAVTLACSALVGGIAIFLPDWRHALLAGYNPITEGQELNRTQTSTADVAFIACSTRNELLETQFRDRCNALVGAAMKSPGSTQVGQAVFQISPEQLSSFGIHATRTTAAQINVVSTAVLGRLETLRTASLDPTTRLASLQLYQDGKPLTGGNAGSEAFGPLGVWINGSFHLGELDSTPAQRGFNFKNWGVTAGADYRILDSLVLGGAFSYTLSDNDFDHQGGHADNDSYIGSIYGSYSPIENLYLDALINYGHLNFDITRNISYAIPTDTVNTHARGDTDGNLWGFTLSSGYNFHYQALNFTPYVRFAYRRLKIDDYHEQGGFGWGMRFEEQHIRSMKSVAGAQVAYAISLPWGVLTPQFRGEWHHEFRDPSRTITASFLGDPLAQGFAIRVPAPDRDYATFGGDLTATFAYGISAFVGYEALVGYQHISSHRITGGVRLQF
jgi:outer membrane lipase/esterase